MFTGDSRSSHVGVPASRGWHGQVPETAGAADWLIPVGCTVGTNFGGVAGDPLGRLMKRLKTLITFIKSFDN